MRDSLELSIVSASPIYAAALQELLEPDPEVCCTRILHHADLEDEAALSDTDVVLVAPHTWEELAGELPLLRRRFTARPWLLLADLRLVGMFLPLLERHRCVLLPASASVDDLREALHDLAGHRCTCLSAELRARLARGMAGRANGRLQLPSEGEMQCACAVSLGLSNGQITETLYLPPNTVKSHLYRLMRKLHLSSRQDLGMLIYRALSS
jgi:DNA-binding NarL/FixJ family response regulator